MNKVVKEGSIWSIIQIFLYIYTVFTDVTESQTAFKNHSQASFLSASNCY